MFLKEKKNEKESARGIIFKETKIKELIKEY